MKHVICLTILVVLVSSISTACMPVQDDSAQGDTVPLTDELLDEFTMYVEDAMERWNIPGAAVGVVQGGEIVYAEGFGVRELGTDDPITPDTVWVMGSMTKGVTNMLVASLVDEGFLDWDTPAVEIWPDFQLANADANADVTVRDLLSMQAGLRRNEDSEIWEGQEFSAEELMEVLAQVSVVGQPGEAWSYDNVGMATGAYLGILAAGGEYGNLFNGYADHMQSRILDPIGMTNASVNIDLDMLRAKVHPNLSWPHLLNENGELAPAEILLEGSIPQEGIIPAGGMIASTNDVARFLMTQLNEGLSPDGVRVVSTENLEETWTPQISLADEDIQRAFIPSSFFVPDDAQVDYGMGWFIGTYHGVEVLTDPGDERGYTNQMTLLPESNTGIVIFTNAMDVCTRFMTLDVQYRFVELLYGMDSQIGDYSDELLDMVGVECPTSTE